MDVWAVLTDLSAYPEWNPLFLQASGQIAVGKVITLTSVQLAAGRTMTVKGGLLVPFSGRVLARAEASFRELNEALRRRAETS